MANSRSAIKRMRTSEARRVRNRAIRSRLRTTVKVARAALEAPPGTDATQLTREATRALDKAVSKGVVHPNAAARRKSALARRLAARV